MSKGNAATSRRSARLKAAEGDAENSRMKMATELPTQDSPFLELPAEMRNRIYQQALHHDRLEGFTANTALLRTCKQIHAEAQGIFKAMATFGVAFTAEKTDLGTPPAQKSIVSVSGDMQLFLDDPRLTNEDQFDAFWDIWPVASQMANHIKIAFETTEAATSRDHYIDLFWLLDGIVLGLDRGSKVTDVQINVGPVLSTVAYYIQRELLYPAARLPSYIKLKLLNASDELVEFVAGLKPRSSQLDMHAELV